MADAVEKVVIIGSGPSGWTAATYAARAALNPLVYEGDPFSERNTKAGMIPLGQLALTTEVENFPTWPFADNAALAAFARSALPPDRFANIAHLYEGKHAHHGKRAVWGPEMMEFARQQAVNFGTRVVTDDILRVDFSQHPFTLYPGQGGEVKALTVILATGARANWLGMESEQRFKNNGVSACAVCDGALPRFRNKLLVVVGGGDTAVEEASYLTKFASEVHMVVRRDVLRASQAMQQRAKSNPKIRLRWNTEVDEVLGNDSDGMTGIRLRNNKSGEKEELSAGGLFLAIGHTPNTDFLDGQVELTPSRYVRWTTPARTYTSVEGVFAAGDVADDYYRQAVTAAGTGCMAALDAERWLGHHGLI